MGRPTMQHRARSRERQAHGRSAEVPSRAREARSTPDDVCRQASGAIRFSLFFNTSFRSDLVTVAWLDSEIDPDAVYVGLQAPLCEWPPPSPLFFLQFLNQP
jgi:hypothetical protein